MHPIKFDREGLNTPILSEKDGFQVEIAQSYTHYAKYGWVSIPYFNFMVTLRDWKIEDIPKINFVFTARNEILNSIKISADYSENNDSGLNKSELFLNSYLINKLPTIGFITFGVLLTPIMKKWVKSDETHRILYNEYHHRLAKDKKTVLYSNFYSFRIKKDKYMLDANISTIYECQRIVLRKTGMFFAINSYNYPKLTESLFTSLLELGKITTQIREALDDDVKNFNDNHRK